MDRSEGVKVVGEGLGVEVPVDVWAAVVVETLDGN